MKNSIRHAKCLHFNKLNVLYIFYWHFQKIFRFFIKSAERHTIIPPSIKPMHKTRHPTKHQQVFRKNQKELRHNKNIFFCLYSQVKIGGQNANVLSSNYIFNNKKPTRILHKSLPIIFGGLVGARTQDLMHVKHAL